jgi:formate dehydrogenase iron-sulfur subunit
MAQIEHHAYLFDATRCIDCRACMVACSVENNIPMNKTRVWVAGVGLMGKYPDLERASMVMYNPDVCIGCRYCMNACPFGVPHFDYDKGIVDGAFIDKCNFCPQRIDNGLEPACVATCPTDALEYGERSELIARAHARIQAHPDRYIDHVYGETENGGTSYLILSHVPFEDLGLPAMGPKPINTITETIMENTIPFALVWTGVLSAVAVGVRAVNHKKPTSVEKTDPVQETEREE